MIDPKYKSFLDLIAWSEGTSSHPLTQNNGYDVIVTGVDGKEIFEDYSDHPFADGRPAVMVRPATETAKALYSSASGRYQITLPTWRYLKAKVALTDFTPASQDLAALELVRERGALLDLDEGYPDLAIELCCNVWASFPGNSYGQGGHALDVLLAKYQAFQASAVSA